MKLPDRSTKEFKNLEISLGLVVGYLLAGSLNMIVFNKSIAQAFADSTLLVSFAGIALTAFLIFRSGKKQQDDES